MTLLTDAIISPDSMFVAESACHSAKYPVTCPCAKSGGIKNRFHSALHLQKSIFRPESLLGGGRRQTIDYTHDARLTASYSIAPRDGRRSGRDAQKKTNQPGPMKTFGELITAQQYFLHKR
jgi:hypothetical protein